MPSLRRPAPAPYFPIGGPVPVEDLVGRDAYLRRAAARLEEGAHVLISGPRRIGKTSIILETLRRVRKRGALVAYVDCLAATDLRSLGEALADAVLANVTGEPRTVAAARQLAAGQRLGRARYDDLAPALELARERSGARAFELALEIPRAVAARTGKRVAVALDEFQAAGRLGARAFDVMRARFQAQRGVAYAFLGSEEGVLAGLFGSRGSAFYRFAQPLELVDPAGPRFGIAPEDWLAYLVRKFGAKRIRLADADADRLLDATGGHPQDTMQLCARLYELARESGRRDVDADMILVAYERAMRELERPFALQWEELGRHKYLQPVAKRIAHGAVLYADDGVVPRAEVLRALDGLRSRGLVVRLGRGRYEFVEPMFADHVRRTDERAAAAILVR